MSEKESEFLKSLKRSIAVSIGSGVVLVLGLILTFYFKTNYKIDEHEKRIDKVENISVSKTEYGARVIHVDYINTQFMNKLDKMDNKLDKLIEK